jgi:biopolymer transport protein ExbD/biopolymer transport protein TolR
MKRQDSRRSRLLCRIDVTGFASVLFALLAMFMVFRQGYDLPRIVPVLFANARHSIPMPGADREDALVVAVSRDGRIYLGSSQVGAEELPPMIREKLKLGWPPVVYLKIDARARYRGVAEALDGIRHAGVETIGLLTNQRREGWPADRN